MMSPSPSQTPTQKTNKNKKRPFSPEACFLSEFDLPGLRWMALYPGRLAALLAAWALLVLFLGDQLGGNAMAIYYKAVFTTSTGTPVAATAGNIYGHLSTANSGPYYLFIAPLLILLAYRFHLTAGRALSNLHERGILRTTGTSWNKIIERRNRRVGLAALVLFPLILVKCIHKQLSSLDESRAGLPPESWLDVKPAEPDTVSNLPEPTMPLTTVGYVQSPNHQQWVNDFNLFSSSAHKLAVIEAQEVNFSGVLGERLFAELERLNLTDDKGIAPCLDYSGGKPVSLRLKDAITLLQPFVNLHAENVLPKNPRLHLWKVTAYFQRLMDTRGKPFEPNGKDEDRADYMVWFRIFVILDQIRIAALFTFMAWLLFKFVFYLTQLYLMLPSGQKTAKELFFKPWARDGQSRFGLGDLFEPYNLLVLCVGTGSLYFALNFPEGGGLKAITHASGAGSGSTRVAHLVVVAAAIACMLAGPLWAYPVRLKKWLEESRLKPLRLRQAETRVKFKTKPVEAEKEWVEITKEEAEILSQSTWPKGDKSFQFSIVVIFTVLLLPLGTATDFLPGGVSKYSRLPQYLRAKCKDFAAKVYELRPSKLP